MYTNFMKALNSILDMYKDFSIFIIIFFYLKVLFAFQNVHLHDTLTTKSWKISNLLPGGRSDADNTSEQGSIPGSAASSLANSPAHSRKGINLLDTVVSLII